MVLKTVDNVQVELEKQTRDGSGTPAVTSPPVSALTGAVSPLGHRTIAYVLPALNGLRRAFVSAPFVFSPSDAAPSSAALAHPSPASLRTVFSTFSTTDLDSPSSAPSEHMGVALATLEQYESGPGLAPTTPLLVALEAQQAYWSSLLVPTPPQSTPDQRWRILLAVGADKGKQPEQLGMPSQIAAEGVQHQALEAWKEVLKAVEDDEGDDLVDLQASQVLVASLVRLT